MNQALMFFLSVTLTGILMSCFQTTPPSIRSVDPKEVAGLLRNDFAVLVDVREPSEQKTGIAEGARTFSFSKVESNENEWNSFIATLPKDKEIIFYSAQDERSGKVAEALAKKGYKTANMGSFNLWAEAGFPVKK